MTENQPHHGPPPSPEHGPQQTDQVAGGEVVVRGQSIQDEARPLWSARTDRVVSWLGFHLLELVGVGVPAVLAVTAHPVWAVPAVLAASAWTAHEVLVARRRLPTQPTQAAATPDAPDDASGDGPVDGEGRDNEGVRRGLA